MGKMEKVQKCIDKRKEKDLIKLAGEKERDVQLAAIAGLGKVGNDDGFNLLIKLLDNPDPELRVAGIKALGVMKNNHADAHLRYLLAHEKDASVIQALKETIPLLRED